MAVRQAPAPPDPGGSLIKLLVNKKLLSNVQLELAQEIQKRRKENIKDVLIRMGWVSEEDIVKLQGELWNVTVFDPDHLKKLDVRLLSVIPEYLSRKHNILPICKENGKVWVAMSDPFDLVVLDDLQRVAKAEIKPLIISEAEIKKYIDQCYQNKTAGKVAGEKQEDHLRDQIIDEMSEFELDIDEAVTSGEEDEQLKVSTSDPPVVRLVSFMLVQAINDKASDIHVEPLEDGIKVRYRVDGSLFDLVSSPKKFKAAILSRIKILSGMDIAVKRVPQDGAFTIHKDGAEVDFRVSSLPIIYGEKIVLRLLVRNAVTGNTLEGLDMGERNLDVFKRNIHRPHGMMLVTGPTGSGKSTTLYTVLNAINDPRKNIITVEDPCEYRLAGIQQVQVKPDLGFDFADALRTILRQDPDIIMIGEIRDSVTAHIAVKASLTGHLVLSTLHTNDAPGAIVRLIDIGLEPFLVASSVTMAVAQRLVKRICNSCKEKYKASIEEKEIIGCDVNKELILHRGKGCKDCRNTGYAGRAAVFEVLEMTPEVKRLILEGGSMDDVRDKAIEQGMETLRDCGFRRMRDGVTTLESVLAVCVGDD